MLTMARGPRQRPSRAQRQLPSEGRFPLASRRGTRTDLGVSSTPVVVATLSLTVSSRVPSPTLLPPLHQRATCHSNESTAVQCRSLATSELSSCPSVLPCLSSPPALPLRLARNCAAQLCPRTPQCTFFKLTLAVSTPPLCDAAPFGFRRVLQGGWQGCQRVGRLVKEVAQTRCERAADAVQGARVCFVLVCVCVFLVGSLGRFISLIRLSQCVSTPVPSVQEV
jgi:hypothetical protein